MQKVSKLNIIPLFLALSLGGVTLSKAVEAEIAGTWLAEDIRGRGVIDNAQSKITFEAGGSVSGSGGCNRFRASAVVSVGKLKIGPIASTRMGCAPALMDQETKFFSALEAASASKIDGAFLRFLAEDGSELLRLTRFD